MRFVFEVKRGSSTSSEIDEDLRRLSCFLSASECEARAFLLVISEKRAPSRFVVGGNSVRRFVDIPNANGRFKVRRTLKAASSFNRTESAHYVSIIEVFA